VPLDPSALPHRLTYERVQRLVGPDLPLHFHPVSQVVVLVGFLLRILQLVRHVHNIGHVADDFVERLDVMLQDVECYRLAVALGIGWRVHCASPSSIAVGSNASRSSTDSSRAMWISQLRISDMSLFANTSGVLQAVEASQQRVKPAGMNVRRFDLAAGLRVAALGAHAAPPFVIRSAVMRPKAIHGV
jgi:hypothetical protein